MPDRAEAETRFGACRHLVESGWEFPVLLHAILSGVPDDGLARRPAWLPVARRLLAEAGLTAEAAGQALNAVRDAWFAADPRDWVAHHRFYPGVVERVVRTLDSPTPVVVVTTKAERFTRALLEAAHPQLAALPVVGREPGRVVTKPETLRRVAAERGLGAGGQGLWFVEDLLETLHAVTGEPDLGAVALFLADWGYNTAGDRAEAGVDARIRLLTLDRFVEPFDRW